MNKGKIRIFEGFAGYGGGSFGLKRLKENLPNIDYEVIGYSEFDKFASSLFDANHKDKKGHSLKNWGDITQIDPDELPDSICSWEGFHVSLFLLQACKWERKILMVEVLCSPILLEYAV